MRSLGVWVYGLVVFFGSMSGEVFGQVYWAQKSIGAGPLARIDAAMASDTGGGVCNLPAAPAYVLNTTVAATQGGLGFVTLSELNMDSSIVSHFVMEPAVDGVFDVVVPDPSQLILDVNGYFAP